VVTGCRFPFFSGSYWDSGFPIDYVDPLLLGSIISCNHQPTGVLNPAELGLLEIDPNIDLKKLVNPLPKTHNSWR
jgi:hypothetical protein